MMISKGFVYFVLLTLIFILEAHSGAIKPKYGPSINSIARPLRHEIEYFKSGVHLGQDFWGLISFYLSQQTGASCSAASVVMVTNFALSQNSNLGAEDQWWTQESLTQKVQIHNWRSRVGLGFLGFFMARGVTLDQLGDVTQESLIVSKIKNPKATAKRLQLGQIQELKKDLVLNEASTSNAMIINFDQGVLTDDLSAGHIAVIGAYDQKTDRVLILDPDRDFYEPYWVSTKKLLESMNTIDPESHKSRGYIFVEWEKT